MVPSRAAIILRTQENSFAKAGSKVGNAFTCQIFAYSCDARERNTYDFDILSRRHTLSHRPRMTIVPLWNIYRTDASGSRRDAFTRQIFDTFRNAFT